MTKKVESGGHQNYENNDKFGVDEGTLGCSGRNVLGIIIEFLRHDWHLILELTAALAQVHFIWETRVEKFINNGANNGATGSGDSSAAAGTVGRHVRQAEATVDYSHSVTPHFGMLSL
jgi:hypothetical protein